MKYFILLLLFCACVKESIIPVGKDRQRDIEDYIQFYDISKIIDIDTTMIKKFNIVIIKHR